MYLINSIIRNNVYFLFCYILSRSLFFKGKLYKLITNNYKREGLSGVYCNLTNLGFSKEDSSHIAEKESSSKFKREITSFWYKVSKSEKLSKQIDNIELDDENSKLTTAIHDTSSIISVLHVGNYWETVAKIIKLSNKEVSFIIPILSLDDEQTRRSILSLSPFCKSLEVVDLSDRSASTRKIARCLKKGYKLIIFPDLPPSIGGVYFGSPAHGSFFNRKASIASGAIELAKLFKLNMVYAISAPTDIKNKVLYVDTLNYEDISVNSNFKIIEDVVKVYPEHWAYLDRVENYFQHQLTEKDMMKKWL